MTWWFCFNPNDTKWPFVMPLAAVWPRHASKNAQQGWIPSRCVCSNRSKRKWEILTCDSAASQDSIPLSQNGSKRPRNSTNPWWFTADGKCGIYMYIPPNGHSNEQNSPRREELKATADRRKQTQELQQFPLSLRGCTKIALLVGKMLENDDHPNRILTFKFWEPDAITSSICEYIHTWWLINERCWPVQFWMLAPWFCEAIPNFLYDHV